MEEIKKARAEYMLLFHDYPDVVTVEQLALMLNISKKLAYRLVANGSLVAIKIGREYKIPKLRVVQYLLG